MQRLLIANRGEIACRVIRAAQALGKETIAVCSDADEGALHTLLADVSVNIGPAPAAKSYLDAERVLRAAAEHGADGIHPGYGFLSESAEFARAVQASGLTWVGPSPDCIARMGDKNVAREIARSCGVPVLPGSGEIKQGDTERLLEHGERVGYPLLVKAVAGGGGIGMHRVARREELVTAVGDARTLAGKAFGDGNVYLERFVANGRHIEIQIFGFGDGRAVHFYERDCSIQRRFQKIVEETPAPGLPDEVLDRMTAAAVALAQSQHYAGPGTVEFLVDSESFEFFFLEMNTRIQVEHGVSEIVTNRDLVQLQIQQAERSVTPLVQDDIRRAGAAIECRIYAENPAKGFMPSPGVLQICRFPDPTPSLRVDTGVREGDRISPYYDAMIAKFIAWGQTRDAAIDAMLEALNHTVISGIRTNVEFLKVLLRHESFQQGRVSTQFIDRELAQLISQLPLNSDGA